MKKRDEPSLPKLKGYAEGEGFILVARRSNNLWIAAKASISPRTMKDLPIKSQDRLMESACVEAIKAVQELYHKDRNKSNKIKGGKENGQRISQ